jgi:hypothetical protein
MNPYHQWKKQCPKCGESDCLKVVEITLAGTHEKRVLSVDLNPDGFEFDAGDGDASTEDEKVKCMICGAKFELCDLAIDTYYRIDPKKLKTETMKHRITVEMSALSTFYLAIQKQALVRAIENAQAADAERLTGILHLIDGVQDELAKGGYTEVCVFPITQDEKQAELKETEVEDLDV